MSKEGLLRLPAHDLIDQSFGRHIGVKDVDAQRLAWLAAQVPEDGVVVEVGSFWGRSAGFMAAAMRPGVRMYCVDKWTNPVDLDRFQRNMAKLGLEQSVSPLQGDSVEVARGWEMDIDLLHIDATHTYAMVQADFQAWAHFVRPGGLIAFHDYGAHTWPAVKRFVDEVAALEFEKLGVHQLIWSGRKIL